MHRRALLRAGAGFAAAGLAGCLGVLGGGTNGVTIEDASASDENGVVRIDVTVANTADGPRRGTIVGAVDVTGDSSGEVQQRQTVRLEAGEQQSLRIEFSDAVPQGMSETTYDWDARLGDVYDPSDPDASSEKTLTDESLGVEVVVEYPPDYGGIAPTLSETTYGGAVCEATERPAVTPMVNFSLSDTARRVTVTFTYDDDDVPNGEEGELVLLRLDRGIQEFVAVEDATVDPETNTVSGSFPNHEIVDVVVYHRPTWEDVKATHDAGQVNMICRG